LIIELIDSDFDSVKDYFIIAIIETDEWFNNIHSLGDKYDFDSSRLEPSLAYTYSIN
jgi:hypothetical protein